MKKIVLKALQLQTQAKIMHWQTNSYAEHMAYGSFYDAIDDLVDKLIEAIQGKYGVRITLGGIDSITLSDYNNIKINFFLLEAHTFFSKDIWNCGISKEDTEIANIVDEIIAEIDKLKYLLTLK
jgi:DNA-binding ferritin-like protein